MGVREAVAKVRKAVAAAVAVIVIAVLKKAGIEIDNAAVEVLVDLALVSGVVYAIPNAKPYLYDPATGERV